MSTVVSTLSVAIGATGAIAAKIGIHVVPDAEAANVAAQLANHPGSLETRTAGVTEGNALRATKVFTAVRSRNSAADTAQAMIATLEAVGANGGMDVDQCVAMVPSDVHDDVDGDLRDMAVELTGRTANAPDGDARLATRFFLEINQPQ